MSTYPAASATACKAPSATSQTSSDGTDVDIDISVGRRLPRDWHFAPVPITVIELVPEYRDYVFVYVEDEYVICDPDTYEVVAVIPAGG